MRFLQVILIISSLILLFVPLLVVESLNDTAVSNITRSDPPASTHSGSNKIRGPSASTPSNDTSSSNITRSDPPASTPSDDTSDSNIITRGSYILIFLNGSTNYLVSPSGNAQFGFYKIICHWYRLSYPFCADHHVVGITFVKYRTLIWKTDRDDYEVPSSILLNNEGELVILEGDKEPQPLIPGIQEPASYAKMYDNGNFVLYGSESQIIWQSFAHPTNSDPSSLVICLLIVKSFGCFVIILWLLIGFVALICWISQHHYKTV